LNAWISDLITLELIKTMIAPAMMISACGLVYLAQVNRYLTITQRIRNLNHERHKFNIEIAEKDLTNLDYFDKVRYKSIEIQIENFLRRGKIMRNSLFSIISAIMFYILTCISTGAMYMSKNPSWQYITIGLFTTGMLLLLSGVMMSIWEIRLSYRSIITEVRSED
jgi:hypothetical protein